MDKREIAAQAERYKNEMMKLYGRSTSVVQDSVKESTPSVLPEEPAWEMPPEAPEETDMEIKTGTEAEEEPLPQTVSELDRRYPDPDLTGLNGDFSEQLTQRQPAREEDFGNSIGYVKVNVRTGDSSAPVKGAVISISGTLSGNRILMGTAVTDESGTADVFKVPVPDVVYSQSPDSKVRPYALYDISVTADGFFNTRSVDVPVFPGIISVQTFEMIPVPLYMSSDDETVTFFNQEPRL